MATIAREAVPAKRGARLAAVGAVAARERVVTGLPTPGMEEGVEVTTAVDPNVLILPIDANGLVRGATCQLQSRRDVLVGPDPLVEWNHWLSMKHCAMHQKTTRPKCIKHRGLRGSTSRRAPERTEQAGA